MGSIALKPLSDIELSQKDVVQQEHKRTQKAEGRFANEDGEVEAELILKQMSDIELSQNDVVQQEHKRTQRAEARFAKDIFLNDGEVENAKFSAHQEAQILLPAPAQQPTPPVPNPLNYSIIALIGAVLMLQAKTNSQYWSMQWKDQSMGMTQAIDLAAPIADQIRSSYNEQATQTEQEATMAMNNAFISGAMFVMAMGLSMFDAFKAMKQPTDKIEGKIATTGEEGKGTASEATGKLEDEESRVAEESNSEDDEIHEEEDRKQKPNVKSTGAAAEERIDNELLKTEDKAAKGGAGTKFVSRKDWAMNKLGLGAKFVGQTLEKSVNRMQMAGMLSQIGTNVNESIMKDQIADTQRKIGLHEAASKEMEQFAQYWNQFFSRAQDQGSAAQQYIDSVLRLYQDMSNTATSTTQSGFRG